MSLTPSSPYPKIINTSVEEIDIAAFKAPRIRELCERWHRLAAGGRLPGYDAFRPETMWEVVGSIMLADVEPGDPPVFRYRLYGTKLAQNIGYDMTKKTVQEFRSKVFVDMVQRDYETLLRLRQPTSHSITAVGEGGMRIFARLLLPLAEDGEHIDTIFSVNETWQG